MLKEFDLTQDPFPIVPDGPVYNWAGHEELKEELEDLVKSARDRDIGMTEFAVVYGDYGAGKSHALRFLRTLINDENKENFDSLALYLPRPRVASKMNFLELYKYTIQEFGKERLHFCCRKLSAIFERIADEKRIAAGMGEVGDKSSFFELAYADLPENDRKTVRLLIRGANSIDPVFDFVSGATTCDGDEFDGKIDSDFLASKVLGQLFRVLTNKYGDEEHVYESVYLFLDEAELLTEAKTSESDLVFAGLRELINEVPYRFCLVLSFSAATALIEAVMPVHLLRRMTRQYIEIPNLGDDQAVEFLRAQIGHFRPEDSKQKNQFYPFEKKAIEYIVENVTDSTPRNLFIQCKRVLERSIRRKGLEPGDTITKDMAEEILGTY